MSTHTEMSQKTKAALCEAAIDSIYELGYANTTSVEIARRAGVTRGALQHHYPRGKIDVFLDVINTYFEGRNENYREKSLSYDEWFEGRMQYFQRSYQDENNFRVAFALMNILLFAEVQNEEMNELRHTYERNYNFNLDLREHIVNGTEGQKKTIRPIYQFLNVFFTGYMMHRNHLSTLGHAKPAMDFAHELLEVWMNHLRQQEEQSHSTSSTSSSD